MIIDLSKHLQIEINNKKAAWRQWNVKSLLSCNYCIFFQIACFCCSVRQQKMLNLLLSSEWGLQWPVIFFLSCCSVLTQIRQQVSSSREKAYKYGRQNKKLAYFLLRCCVYHQDKGNRWRITCDTMNTQKFWDNSFYVQTSKKTKKKNAFLSLALAKYFLNINTKYQT